MCRPSSIPPVDATDRSFSCSVCVEHGEIPPPSLRGAGRLTRLEVIAKRAGGFNLVEVIAVLVVLAVLAVIFTPRNANDQVVLSAEAQKLQADIRHLQALAMSRGKRHQMMLTVSATPVIYQFMLTSGAVVLHPVAGNAPVAMDNQVSVNLTNLPNRILAFDSQGAPYQNALATIALTSAASIRLTVNGNIRTLTIQPQTGSVQ